MVFQIKADKRNANLKVPDFNTVVYLAVCLQPALKNTAYRLPGKIDAFSWTFHMLRRQLGQGNLISVNDAVTRLALLSHPSDLTTFHDITKRLVSTIMQILTK